jgi:hypothetical protein
MGSRGIRWAGHVAYMKEKINAEFCGDTGRERRLGRPGCRWDYNKFLNFTELEWEGIDCVCLDQGRQYGDMTRIC